MIKRLGYLFFLIILRNKIVIVKNFSHFSNINIIDLYFKCNYQCQAVFILLILLIILKLKPICK